PASDCLRRKVGEREAGGLRDRDDPLRLLGVAGALQVLFSYPNRFDAELAQAGQHPLLPLGVAVAEVVDRAVDSQVRSEELLHRAGALNSEQPAGLARLPAAEISS